MDERTLQRFMSWIEVQPNGCWYWKGKPNRQGYGYFWLDGKSRLAHRVSYMHFVGPIPEKYEIDHLCHTWDKSCPGGTGDKHRKCVRPDHLEAVTELVNVMRSNGVAAKNAAKTHCDKDHEFTEANTYLTPKGERICRTCRDASVKAWAKVNRPAEGPHNRDKTHCDKGNHPLSGDNLRINSAGRRVCIACTRKRDRETKKAKRDAAKAVQRD